MTKEDRKLLMAILRKLAWKGVFTQEDVQDCVNQSLPTPAIKGKSKRKFIDYII